MRKLLNESESIRNRANSGRASSFRFSSEEDCNKIDRGQIGSVSASGFRSVAEKGRGAEFSSSSEESSDGSLNTVEKNFGRRLMRGLKSAFGLQKKKSCDQSKGTMMKINGEKLEEDGNENVVIIKKDQAFDRRTHSQS